MSTLSLGGYKEGDWIRKFASEPLPCGKPNILCHLSQLSREEGIPASHISSSCRSLLFGQSKNKVPSPAGVGPQPGAGAGFQSVHHRVAIVHEGLVKPVGESSYIVTKMGFNFRSCTKKSGDTQQGRTQLE